MSDEDDKASPLGAATVVKDLVTTMTPEVFSGARTDGAGLTPTTITRSVIRYRDPLTAKVLINRILKRLFSILFVMQCLLDYTT